MKTPLYILALVLMSCSKANKSVELTALDTQAVTGMTAQTDSLLYATNILSTASNEVVRHHWDSLFHHHDSLFWAHHSNYNITNNHPHNDHHHQWVPYDPAVNHSRHYHRPYPGHRTDSLVIVSNGHHPNHNIHHTTIHGLHHHHIMDSLHHIHQVHHR